MPRTIKYMLSEKEDAAADKFIAKHTKKHGRCQAAAGGRYSWHLHPCGIGTAIDIVCNQCHEKKDISDYEW